MRENDNQMDSDEVNSQVNSVLSKFGLLNSIEISEQNKFESMIEDNKEMKKWNNVEDNIG